MMESYKIDWLKLAVLVMVPLLFIGILVAIGLLWGTLILGVAVVSILILFILGIITAALLGRKA